MKISGVFAFAFATAVTAAFIPPTVPNYGVDKTAAGAVKARQGPVAATVAATVSARDTDPTCHSDADCQGGKCYSGICAAYKRDVDYHKVDSTIGVAGAGLVARDAPTLEEIYGDPRCKKDSDCGIGKCGDGGICYLPVETRENSGIDFSVLKRSADYARCASNSDCLTGAICNTDNGLCYCYQSSCEPVPER